MKSLSNKTSFYLTDGGLETDLIFNKGLDLPHFASFPLIEQPTHMKTLKDYYRSYMNIAADSGSGFILESPTWRASPDWAYKLGYSAPDLKGLYSRAMKLMKDLKSEFKENIESIYVCGQLGPRGDGYDPGKKMTIEEASEYHRGQIANMHQSGAEIVSAHTMCYLEEVIGITMSAKEEHVPVVISFTVERDGRLPDGTPLGDAIQTTDLQTDGYPLYYMINCAHPSHFIHQLDPSAAWCSRIQGIRANASCKSHAELNDSASIDKGDKDELAGFYSQLAEVLPNLKVIGGCCGTDASHIESICRRVL